MNQNPAERPSQWMFWGCFIALITTAFAFITRAFMVNMPEMWPADFGLDEVQRQTLFGHGIWPFAISIILFSLIIDKIGYRTAMVFSFVCYAIYAVLALSAYSVVKVPGLAGEELEAARSSGLLLLTIGSIVLALGNGTVEAFINPVVATMFSKEKTKWLNILHAGWPGGLVLGGLITLWLGPLATSDWRYLVYMMAIPSLIYLLMLIGARFPVSERVAAGATYKQMLAEFGFLGAALASFLIIKQVVMVYNNSIGESGYAIPDWGTYTMVAIASIGYGLYCGSLGRPMMFLLCVIMMPLATTELGTDGAITGIMEEPMKALGFNALWVLIYTAGIMTILRFFAGPIINAFTPLGLLAICSVLAIVGLFWLSFAQGLVVIFIAATVYGIGKTFFWPTMLGVVAEQYPRGGALTLNAIAGIGMLTVGVMGAPLIGKMQADSARVALNEQIPGVYERIQKEDTFFLGDYLAIDDKKLKELPEEEREKVESVASTAKQGALAKVTVFPAFMLICYLGMILYFRSQGGYKPVDATAGH